MRRLLHFAFRTLTDPRLADAILGDLEEARRVPPARTRLAGALWFWRQAAGILLYIAAQRAASVLRRPFGPRLPGLAFMSDLHYAIRALNGSRWYSAAVVSVIALGFALSTTVFAIVDGVLFKPLPYRDAHELYLAYAHDSTNKRRGAIRLSPKDVRDWSHALPDARFAMFEITGGISTFGAVNGRPISTALIDPEFLDVLGVRPMLGGFVPGDFVVSSIGPFGNLGVPGLPPVSETMGALVTYRFWQQFFGGEVSAVGRTFQAPDIPQLTFRIVGVLPPDFAFPAANSAPDLLLPLGIPPSAYERRAATVRAVARLPATRSLAEYQARLDGLMRAARAEYHASWTFDSVRLTPMNEEPGGSAARAFALVFGAAAGLALLACVNVASLATARARNRRHVFALRRALGATGWHLARLVLAESVVLVSCAAAIGLMFSHAALETVVRLLPEGIALYKAPQIDLRVFMFVLALTVLTTLAIGLSMTRAVARAHLFASVDRVPAGITPRAARPRFLVIGVQVAVALVLTLGGTLFVVSLTRALSEEIGYEVDRTLALTVHIGADQRGPVSTARLDSLVQEVRRQPGVEEVGALDSPLLRRANATPPVEWPAHARHIRAEGLSVGGGFFQVARPALIEGRYPAPSELDAGKRVAVVSEGVARGFWPGTSAVGRTLQGAAWAGRSDTFEVVGVVANARVRAMDLDSHGQIYLPIAVAGAGRAPILLVRTARRARGVEDTLIRAIAAMGSPYSLQRIEPLEARLRDSVRIRVFQASIFGSFAGAALLLAAVGVFGLIAMAVSHRTREMAVRLALGATRPDVIGLLMREQLAAVLAGLGGGSLIALWLARLVRSQVYKITVYDPTLWSAAIATVLAAATIGVFVPAWRASRLNPVNALRED